MATISRTPDHKPLLHSWVESIPNGRSYGREGHVPCDHVAVFEYEDCTRRFDGTDWTMAPHAVERAFGEAA
jgi:hypothetical protein